MNTDHTLQILEQAGIKPTSNRILVLRSILHSERPLCLTELERELETLDKSSVSRVLTLLQEKGLIHAIEDGRGITRFEPCHGDHCHDGSEEYNPEDLHAHFFCELCHKVYCFPDIITPRVKLPDGFVTMSINYMMKGICPKCKK